MRPGPLPRSACASNHCCLPLPAPTRLPTLSSWESLSWGQVPARILASRSTNSPSDCRQGKGGQARQRQAEEWMCGQASLLRCACAVLCVVCLPRVLCLRMLRLLCADLAEDLGEEARLVDAARPALRLEAKLALHTGQEGGWVEG